MKDDKIVKTSDAEDDKCKHNFGLKACRNKAIW
jgi:hypothetical protein